MGSMLIRKFIATDTVQPSDIMAHSKTGVSAKNLAHTTGIKAVQTNSIVAENAEVLFICVKPMDVRDVFQEISGSFKPGTLIISIAACVSLSNLEKWAGPGARCVRVIPSLTAEKEAGISLVSWGTTVTQRDRDLALNLFNALGVAIETDEKNLDVYSDLTSCGPALIAAMMKEFASSAARTGLLDQDLAEYLVKETMAGTVRILAGDTMNFDTLIRRVATPGGITEQGLKVLTAGLPVVFDEVHEATSSKRRIVTAQVMGKK